MITVRTFGNFKRMNLDFERPDGADHDQNTYCFRMVDGAMVFRGVALGSGWESRTMNWSKLSCFKQREDEEMGISRPTPTDEELKQVLQDCGSVYKMAKHYNAGFNTVRKWLLRAGLIDDDNQPIAEGIKPMGCVETEQPVPISVDEPDDQGDIGVNYCHACGEPCEGQAAYCPDCAEYQDIPAPVMVKKEFDRKAFVLEIIESVMELSQLRNVPAEITVELIDAVLVVA